MSNAIYSSRLEYTSLSKDPIYELRNAINITFKDESICKSFGYLFENNDRYRMVFIVNSSIFEMDVIVREKEIIIIKGTFNDIKMYLVAKVSKHLNIMVPYNAFEYIERRIIRILNTPILTEFINVSLEISHMKIIIKKMTGSSLEILINFRTNLKRFKTNKIMINEMSDPFGLGINLSQYLANMKTTEFAIDVLRLYLIQYLLEYPELNETAKSYCRIALLEHHHINYDRYEDVTYDIAEWIHNKYFNQEYNNDLEIDLDYVD